MMDAKQLQEIKDRCEVASKAIDKLPAWFIDELLPMADKDIQDFFTNKQDTPALLAYVDELIEKLHKAYDKQDEYGCLADKLEAERDRYKARAEALEKAFKEYQGGDEGEFWEFDEKEFSRKEGDKIV